MKIIAEIGSNWDSMDDCLKSIDEAKTLRADAVKFQMFNDESLYGMKLKGDDFIKIPFHWVPDLAKRAKQVGIEFMCSAFSVTTLEAVNPHVSHHKIASSEACHIELLKKIKEWGKPTYISTAGKSVSDLQQVIEYLNPNVSITLMYCVGQYPARYVNFARLEEFKKIFGSKVRYGYSDHSLDVLNIPMIAKNHGCQVLEKHVNLCGWNKGADNPHSLNVREFDYMIKSLKGEPVPTYMQDTEFMLKHNRRLITTKPISVGDTLMFNYNFGIYRSRKNDAEGMHPFAVDYVKGKKCNKAKVPGDPITPKDL